jgi:hypothetical protein
MALRSLASYHSACLSKNAKSGGLGNGSTGVTDVELRHLSAMVTAVEPEQLDRLRVTLEASPTSIARTLVFVLERAVAGGESDHSDNTNTQQQNRDHAWRLLVRLVQLYATGKYCNSSYYTCILIVSHHVR